MQEEGGGGGGEDWASIESLWPDKIIIIKHLPQFCFQENGTIHLGGNTAPCNVIIADSQRNACPLPLLQL